MTQSMTSQPVATNVIENINQRSLPIWSRVLLGALVLVFVSFIVWILWMVESAKP
jgi:hypothetical protein